MTSLLLNERQLCTAKYVLYFLMELFLVNSMIWFCYSSSQLMAVCRLPIQQAPRAGPRLVVEAGQVLLAMAGLEASTLNLRAVRRTT